MCRAPNGIAHLKKPADCATKELHPAAYELGIENGELKCNTLSHDEFKCDVPMQAWQTNWNRFRTGNSKVYLCKSACVEMGVVW
jgi:hypothetical protein